MSRPINIQSAITVNVSSYSGYTGSISSVAGANSGTTSSANTSQYATITPSSTSSSGYAIYRFDTSEIPSNATINSVYCAARGRASGSNRVRTSFQLFAKNTAKGSPVFFTSNTSTAYTLTTGTWNYNEIQDVRLRVGSIRTSTSNTGSTRFYGATLTVNYSIIGTLYEVSAKSETFIATIEPTYQEISDGDSATLAIETDNISEIIVEDNGNEVTDLLVMKQKIDSGETESVPKTTYTTAFSGGSNSAFYNQSNTGTSSNARLLDCLGYSAENPNMTNATSSQRWTYVKDGGNNTATGWINYEFDFSNIPSDATITNVSVRYYGARESSTISSTYVARVALYSGNSLKSTEQNISSTSNTLESISNVGSWTRDELQNARFRFTVGYYGGWIGGITWEITYRVPVTGNQFYYEYTISSISSDHTVIVSENIILPPDEDEDKEYYPITISSINATTEPPRGTERVESGTDMTVLVYPTDPVLTLALDNGVDVTSSLIPHTTDEPTYTVSTANGASYGFALNGNNYYQSQNNRVDKSAAVCRIDFNLPVRCLVTIQYINYAEATYDFGVFGNIDSTLSNTYYSAGNGGATITDSSYKLACNTSSYNTSSVQTITYEIPAGEHYIYVKYSKDDATSSNNDTLQFKISNIEQLETTVNYYEYPLTGINQSHSLVFIFGNVQYYFVGAETESDCKLYPNGQMVALQGDDYRVTIVVKRPTDVVSVTDNGVNVTSALEKKEVETVKDGVSSTTVNYIYKLTNIQTGHTIVVTSVTQSVIYRKEGGTWSIKKVYKKNARGEWEEIENYSGLFLDGNVYING